MARTDFGAGAGGAISGGTAGFGIAGLPGAAAGAVLGGLGGLFGGRKKKKKRSTLDKRQQMINEQQQQGILGQGPLADLYNYNPDRANEVFEKTIANPAYRGFQEKVIPGITGAFRSEGLQNSSYAGDALSRAGRDVQEGLDARRAQYLYDTESEARGAKRSGIENYQNRTNFDYDTSYQGGFDINRILDSIPKEAYGKVAEHFRKNPVSQAGG